MSYRVKIVKVTTETYEFLSVPTKTALETSEYARNVLHPQVQASTVAFVAKDVTIRTDKFYDNKDEVK